MKQSFLLTALFCIYFIAFSSDAAEWTIIGAGPAGIAAVGLLLDAGIPPKAIYWVDPKFNVGRMGQYYENVPGNASSKLYVQYLQSCKYFQSFSSPALTKLYSFDRDVECELRFIIAALSDISESLVTTVQAVKDCLRTLDYKNKTWSVGLKESETIHSKNVIIATGSHPRSLNYDNSKEIPLDLALDRKKLEQVVSKDDSVAVIGSAHSAILILQFLTETNAGRILNFYNKPLLYPVDMGDWTLHAESGLRGQAATWAQEVLEKKPPANLVRIKSCDASLKAWLPICNKIIYAVGYERNELPPINNDCTIYNNYDGTNGIIGPHLFGIGIAFPEINVDPQGNKEHRVGMHKFMEYIQENLPEWMKQKNPCRVCKFSSLFDIAIL